MMKKSEIAKLPLRERKKEMIKQAILKSAERLFESRGYDQVTVVEIADGANISVKTLFTYFRSKEDLVFQDSRLIDAIIDALRNRPEKTTNVEAVIKALIKMIRENGTAEDSLAGFQRGYGESEALQSRILRLWDEYENIVALELARQENIEIPTALHRFLAAQLITLIRSTTWKEVYEIALKNKPHSSTAIEKWVQDAGKLINL